MDDNEERKKKERKGMKRVWERLKWVEVEGYGMSEKKIEVREKPKR